MSTETSRSPSARGASTRSAGPSRVTSWRTAEGIPDARPEIDLLFKAKTAREKDEADFAATLPRLRDRERRWLAEELSLAHPGHRWIDVLLG